MIDTSIVRVHQHGACISRNQRQSMGRSRGGLTSKIHALVDGNGLPVRLALSPGEAHDNRLVAVLLLRVDWSQDRRPKSEAEWLKLTIDFQEPFADGLVELRASKQFSALKGTVEATGDDSCFL